MKLLIIGYSDLVKRKIIPAIAELKSISTFDLASSKKADFSFNKLESIYKDYSKAINSSNADLVYISLPNSMHFKFCEIALKNNKNVIVDKPAILNKNQLDVLFNLSKKNNLAISMSCIFNYHKCWSRFKSLSRNNNEHGLLSAHFTIPELKKSNIRMSNNLGGGALNDMGIYASTAGKLFWESKVKKLSLNLYKEKNLVKSFTINANYGNGKDFIGHFGFGKTYKNQINFYGSKFSTEYQRVFSPHPDYDSYIKKETHKSEKLYRIGQDDTFKKYIETTVNKLKNNKAGLRNEFYSLNLEYTNFLSNE